MGIKINEIPTEGLTLELTRNVDLFDQGRSATTFTAALSIRPVGGGVFHFTGSLQATAEIECSRCLTRFPQVVVAEINFNLAPAKVINEEAEHELERAELDTEFYQGEEIDPDAIIKEQILLALPMVPLHSPDCKGLCPVCGTDRNLAECGCETEGWGKAGAFSVLRDIFRK